MAKAINWPKAFRDEILAEDTEQIYCAFRLGTVYYDGGYWVDGEEVDIRCNHLKLRRAIIHGALKACPIETLTDDDLAHQKKALQSVPAVVSFLAQTYDQPVTPETVITVVYYKNLPVNPELVESE